MTQPCGIGLRIERAAPAELATELLAQELKEPPVVFEDHIADIEEQRLGHGPTISNMRRTGLITHERYFWHDPGPSAGGRRPDGTVLQIAEAADHPDTKRRLLGLLEATGYDQHLRRIRPRSATVDELLQFHTHAYIEHVSDLSTAGFGEVGRSAYVGAGTYEIALLSAGGAIAATDAVLRGTVDNAYALVRPAGHHAERDRGLGFCIFANIVFAAHHARILHGLERIAIVDYDVHHGNGTQQAFYDDPNVLTISVHQDGRFPTETGSIGERGEGTGFGANINIPLPPGSGHGAFTAAFEQVIVPALERFRPQLLLVSSGFDAGGFDAMAHMMAHSATFAMMASHLLEVAEHHCDGRLVAVHEGGYSTFHVPFCGLAVIEQMTGIASGIADPYLSLASLPYQDLQAHQAAVISAAAALVGQVPG
jgi:acetoin utilization deacetylase AcuC-like enzyme